MSPPRRLALLLALSSTVACADEDETKPTFDDDHIYAHAVVPEEDCPDGVIQTDDGALNCNQVVEFCWDGAAAILLTDILTEGTYRRDGDEVVVDWGAGDAPSRMTFTLLDEGRAVRDDYLDQIWERPRLEGNSFEETYCFQRNDG